MRKIKPVGGFTMVEMLVAMAIAGIFLSIFIGVVVATFQTLRTGDERTVAQQNARIAMRFIVQDIKQAIVISPRRFEEPYDPVYRDLPRNEDSKYNYDPNDPPQRDAYPLYRRTTDADDLGNTPGYIDLDYDGEYIQFWDSDAPFDVRPLAPNRLELLLNSDSFYANTQYWSDREYDIDVMIDPGAVADNQQALRTRVTYEHQVAPPKVKIYKDPFTYNEKNFNLAINRNSTTGVPVDEEFCIVRSFESEFFDNEINWDVTENSEVDPGVDYDLNVDSYAFRQPLADHIIDVRFRYWHVMPVSPDPNRASPLVDDNVIELPSSITGNTPMIEIRYDPDISHAEGTGGTPIDTDDGYYRYYTARGQEIYVWFHHDEGAMVEYADPTLSDPFSPVQPYSFITQEDPRPGWEDYERGVLLFEGWRFINMISVTIRGTNRENLDRFKASIDPTIADPADDDWRVGFIDFGKGSQSPTNLDDFANPNTLDPFYRAVDTYRSNTVNINAVEVFDFVEPNINANYDPNSFVTLEMFVVPPIMKTIVEQNERMLTYGFSYKGPE